MSKETQPSAEHSNNAGRPDLDALCAAWQKRLRLQHWTVHIRYHRNHERNGVNAGNNSYEANVLMAHISVLDPCDWPSKLFPQDVEETVVHELLHLWFAPVEPREAGATMVGFEQAICTTAKSLIAALRENK